MCWSIRPFMHSLSGWGAWRVSPPSGQPFIYLTIWMPQRPADLRTGRNQSLWIKISSKNWWRWRHLLRSECLGLTFCYDIVDTPVTAWWRHGRHSINANPSALHSLSLKGSLLAHHPWRLSFHLIHSVFAIYLSQKFMPIRKPHSYVLGKKIKQGTISKLIWGVRF